MKTMLFALTVFGLSAMGAKAQDYRDYDDGDRGYEASCAIPSATVQAIQAKLAAVVVESDHNGGLLSPNLMWSSIVDRNGVLCSVIKSGDAFPGSRAVAIAKAETANGFSNDKIALSTANLYGPSLPGGSLYGLNATNPFNPLDNKLAPGRGAGTGVGRNPGGVATLGGGVALYQNGKVIGGLGVSGDTACADHAIAYRMRHLAGLDGIPGGVGPGGTDNISYYKLTDNVATMSPLQFSHAHCSAGDITP